MNPLPMRFFLLDFRCVCLMRGMHASAAHHLSLPCAMPSLPVPVAHGAAEAADEEHEEREDERRPEPLEATLVVAALQPPVVARTAALAVLAERTLVIRWVSFVAVVVTVGIVLPPFVVAVGRERFRANERIGVLLPLRYRLWSVGLGVRI